MENNKSLDYNDLELICIIVNFNMGSKAIKIAKRNNVSGGTIFLGRGTVKNKLLEVLDLSEARKEIVFMIADRTTVYRALDVLNKELGLHKPNHGIAFTIPVVSIIGSHNYPNQNIKENKGEEDSMYQAIFTIVDRGNAEDVIDAAKKGGARGGTIIHARGSGIHETQTLFSMPIEPEKEIALIVCNSTQTESIVSSIKNHIHIDEPGKGIIFVINVNKAYGLY